jgi:hypothetical protein
MKCSKIERFENKDIKTIKTKNSQIVNENYDGKESICICPLTFLDHLLRQQEKCSGS